MNLQPSRDIAAPVTVVIPCYNAGDLIIRALASVARQTTLPQEIILVDDGSTVPVQTTLDEYWRGRAVLPLRVVRKENGGPSSARNMGIALATQEFIAFLDADDEMAPDRLSNGVQILRNLSSEYFGVYGRVSDEHGSGQDLCYFDGFLDVARIGGDKGFPGGCPAYIFRRAALLCVGGLDEDLVNYEDFDLLIRLTRQGYKCSGPYGAAVLQHRQAVSVSRPSDPYTRFNSATRFFAKAEVHGYFSDSELVRRQEVERRALAKRLLRKRRFVEAAREFDIAFKRLPADGFTERLLWLWTKTMLLIVHK